MVNVNEMPREIICKMLQRKMGGWYQKCVWDDMNEDNVGVVFIQMTTNSRKNTYSKKNTNFRIN